MNRIPPTGERVTYIDGTEQVYGVVTGACSQGVVVQKDGGEARYVIHPGELIGD